MASPHMAGVMALLRQTHPSWSVEELKALAMNTAGSDVYIGFGQTGDKPGPGRVGSGRVQIAAALASDSIAYNNDDSGSVSVSFGAVEVENTFKALTDDPRQEHRHRRLRRTRSRTRLAPRSPA